MPAARWRIRQVVRSGELTKFSREGSRAPDGRGPVARYIPRRNAWLYARSVNPRVAAPAHDASTGGGSTSCTMASAGACRSTARTQDRDRQSSAQHVARHDQLGALPGPAVPGHVTLPSFRREHQGERGNEARSPDRRPGRTGALDRRPRDELGRPQTSGRVDA